MWRRVPRHMKRSNEGSNLVVHLGYLVEGRQGWVGVSATGALEIGTIGLWPLHRKTIAILALQIFPGQPAHALQMKHALWP